jgi:hypothetical protein
VTAQLWGKGAVGALSVEGLEGATPVQELLRRAAAALRVPLGTEVAVRCEARWLKAEETLAGAGVAAGDVVDVCVGEQGGMPGVFASPAAQVEDGGDELAGALGALLGQYSGDVSSIAVAVQRLGTLQEPPLALQQAETGSVTVKVIIYAAVYIYTYIYENKLISI